MAVFKDVFNANFFVQFILRLAIETCYVFNKKKKSMHSEKFYYKTLNKKE